MDFTEKSKDVNLNAVDDQVVLRGNWLMGRVELQEIKYYPERNGFRTIKRLMHISHVSVINLIKQLASN